MLLVGDVGGTSARLALYEVQGGALARRADQTFRSREYAGLAEVAERFLAGRDVAVDAACFGIAGPIRDGRVKTPNLPWEIAADEVARALRVGRVDLINDLEANAYGIATLAPNQLETLQPGAAGAAGNAAVISAGTGLGEAGLYWDGRRHMPFACEGGHADFAPRSPLEVRLLSHLAGRWDRVSYERVLSGPGLVNIYEFLRDAEGWSESPDIVARMGAEDGAAVISGAALDGACPLCAAALDMLVSIYGAEAGNLALKLLATGGVYIGGGIAPKILAKLRGEAFLEAFRAKGRMRPLMEAMPVRVILDPNTALAGAARYAALAAGLLD